MSDLITRCTCVVYVTPRALVSKESRGDLFRHNFRHDGFDAPHLPTDQPHLDAVGVRGRFGEQALHHSLGERAGLLITFKDNCHTHTGFKVGAAGKVSHTLTLHEV